MSVEFYPIIIDVPDLGTVPAKLLRSGAPLTVKAMYLKMQEERFILGRGRWNDQAAKDAITFGIGIQKGKEGRPVKLQPGDIGYSYHLDTVIFQFSETGMDAVKIGDFKEGMALLGNLKNGMSVKLKLAK